MTRTVVTVHAAGAAAIGWVGGAKGGRPMMKEIDGPVRCNRLKGRKEFDRVYREGRRAVDDDFVMHVVRNGLAWTRLAIVTSRKIGNAVQRNLARRKVRETIRGVWSELPVGVDVVCVVRRRVERGRKFQPEAILVLIRRANRNSSKR